MSDDIYDLLLRRGLTRSQRHFSTVWAGCAPNYLALGGGVSDTVAITVFRQPRRRTVLVDSLGRWAG